MNFSLRTRALSALTAVVASAFAAPAVVHAATQYIYVAPPVAAKQGSWVLIDPCVVNSASVSNCNDKAWKASTCGQKWAAQCVPLLRTQYQNTFPSTGSPATIVPPDDIAAPASDQFSSRGVTYDPSRIKVTNPRDGSYEGTLLQQHAGHLPNSLSLNPRVFGANLMASDPYETDGTHVNSCAEYTYKKWYDYNRFADAAASCGGYAPCIYDLAMRTATPGLNKTLYKKTTSGTEPQPLQRPNPPTTTQPKNPWHVTTPGGSEYLTMFDYYIGKHSSLSTAYYLEQAYLAGHPYTITDRWAWHQQMHAQQAQYKLVDDDFASIKERTAKYLGLLQQFIVVDARMQQYDTNDRQRTLNPRNYDKCGNMHLVGAPSPTTGPCVGQWVPNNPQSLSYANLLDQLGQAIADEWAHVANDRVTNDHGCLDPNSNRCDWSPEEFASEYTHLFQAQMENDYTQCVFWTGNSFTYAQPPIYTSGTDYSVDADSLEAWFLKANIAVQQTEREMPWISPTSNTIGGGKNGGHKIGDDSWASVDYTYSSGWSMQFDKISSSDPNTNGLLCGTDAHLGGSLVVKASVLGSSVPSNGPVFDGELTADTNSKSSTGSVSAYLNILGNELLPRGTGATVTDAAGYHYAYDVTNPIASIPTIDFPVCGVNVTINAQANVVLGFSFDATAGGPAGCPNTPLPMGGTGNVTLMNMNATATPSAGVTVSVEAAIDEAIIEVGIRGDLNLITANVPLNTNLSASYANGSTYLTLANTSSLDLSELSGDVKAFGDLCLGPFCEGISIELFSWDGAHQSYPIYASNNSWPLTNVAGALAFHKTN